MSIEAIQHFGLSHSGKRGEGISFAENRAASYMPKALQESHNDELQLFQKLIPDFENHFERNCQLFLLQLLLVHRRGWELRGANPDHQIGKGTNPYPACHVATLSSLILGYDTALGKGTPLYDTFNETTVLPREVNQTDSRIGRHHRKLKTDYALWMRALFILNAAADPSGELDPKNGLLKYLDDALSLIQTAIKVDAKKEGRMIILKAYDDVANSYRKQLMQGDDLIKKLVGRVKIEEEVTSAFYSTVQKELFTRFFGPSTYRHPLPLNPPTPHLYVVPTPATEAEEKKTPPADKKESLSGRALEYASICAQSETVTALVKKYFKSMQKKQIEVDREELDKLKQSTTARRYCQKMSEAMWSIHSACLEAIRIQRSVKEPQNMGRIIKEILDPNS